MKLPDHRREECLSAAIVQTLWLMVGCSLVFMVTAYASNPGWWSSVLNGNPANDYMVANQGQLKNFTSVAVSEMNATLTNAGGSGPALSNLVYGWQQDYATNGYGATNLKPSDYAGINVGQLKYVGNLVWSQLIAAGYTEYPPSWLDGSNASDLQAANLGQMKEVFNFDPAVAPASVTGLTATPEPCGIYLTWTDPPDDPMTNLLVQEDIGGTWTTIATLDASATSYEASALTPGDSYDLQVIASNGFTSSTPTTAPSTQPLPTHPAELSGTLDTTNTYMNLSWPASSGATAYEIDREAITNATWTTNYASASSTNYADTNYASTGYRYRIRASADGTHYSAPSNVFPQPRYVIIDLGTNQIPLYFNNAGAVVLRTGTGALAYTYWSGGTNTILPLTPYGLNDNGVVIGTETNSILYGNTNTADFQVYYTPATTWTVGGGLGAPLPAPTSDYIADQPITTESYIFSEWEGSIGGTPVGIGDDNTTVYGNYGEGWQVNEGGYPLSQDAGFGARLDTLTAIGSDIVSYLESYTNNSPDPVSAGGTYYHFQTQNGANVALGYKQTVTTDDYGVYGPYQSSLGGPILPQTWVAYDGTEFDLAGIPAGIASNNDISGTDTHSPPQAFYLWTNLSTSPVTLVNGIAGAINNQDQIVSTNYYWQSNQLFNLNDLVADTNGWINIFSGNSTNTFNGAINDGGAIAATAYHLGTNHAIMLLPCQFRLLNGSTNAADVDGMDFNGNRPTTMSATIPYATTGVVNWTTNAENGIDLLGVAPLGQGRANDPGDAYVVAIMMLAKVSPPAATNITYGWNRVYEDQSVTITKTATNTWYVNEAPGSSTTPVEDSSQPPGNDKTIVPSTNNNVVVFSDAPGMAISDFTSGAPNTNDYAYEKTDFTYTLTNSIGSASAIATQPVGQRILAKRIATSGVTTTDWAGQYNIMSTTNIPNCTTVSTNEIRNIVGGTNGIIFDPSVPGSP